jgi:6-phosphogluconolactonase/glucosamine-6-phosphate isomerase/deaminase
MDEDLGEVIAKLDCLGGAEWIKDRNPKDAKFEFPEFVAFAGGFTYRVIGDNQSVSANEIHVSTMALGDRYQVARYHSDSRIGVLYSNVANRINVQEAKEKMLAAAGSEVAALRKREIKEEYERSLRREA